VTKKKSQQQHIRRNVGIDLPAVVNMDELAVMTDEELSRRAYLLEQDRSRLGEDAVPWEVEIAYVRREQDLRVVRQGLQEAYVRRGGDEVAAS
jgi:hypothetical protein